MQNPNQMINNQMKMNQNCMPNQYQIQRPPRMTMPMNNYQNMGQQFRGNPGKMTSHDYKGHNLFTNKFSK